MSKAFVKDDAPTEELGFLPRPPIPGAENYITRMGFERLREELEKLQNERAQEIHHEESNQGRLREVNYRIEALTHSLGTAVVVDPTSSDRVVFGASVDVLDESGIQHTYHLVGTDEINVKEGKISWASPIGKALLEAKIGDDVIVRRPQGDEVFEILNIRF